MTDAADYNCPVCEAWIGKDGKVESANARSFHVDDRTLVKCGGVECNAILYWDADSQRWRVDVPHELRDDT